MVNFGRCQYIGQPATPRTLSQNVPVKCHANASTCLKTLQWRHNDHNGVWNHQPHGCLLNRLFRRRSKKRSKHRFTGVCVGNSPETSEFPTQRASNAENVSILWRHHVLHCFSSIPLSIISLIFLVIIYFAIHLWRKFEYNHVVLGAIHNMYIYIYKCVVIPVFQFPFLK